MHQAPNPGRIFSYLPSPQILNAMCKLALVAVGACAGACKRGAKLGLCQATRRDRPWWSEAKQAEGTSCACMRMGFACVNAS